MLNELRKNLIVSCQPLVGGSMDHPEIIAAMAKAAVSGGAVAVRIEGVENVKAVRAIVECPIIGLIKVDTDDTPIRITPYNQNIRDLVSAGSEIIAVDATDRPRPETLASAIDLVHQLGSLFMADCATYEEAIEAQKLGADIIATTMSGYTDGLTPEYPDLKLVTNMATLDAFVIAEGRFNTPALAAKAIMAGADAVVVGSAITRLETITSWFTDAIKTTAIPE